jgi:hypothetical protein
VLSRIPLLRDTHSAMEEWNQRENEMNQEDGDDDFDDLAEEVEEEGDDDDDGDDGEDGDDEEEIEVSRGAKAQPRRGGVTFEASVKR